MADPTPELPHAAIDPADDPAADCAVEGNGVLQFLSEIFGLSSSRGVVAADGLHGAAEPGTPSATT